MAGLSPEDVVRAYGGQARTAELISHLTPGRLRTAVAAGRLVRPRRGVYVLPLLPDPQVAAEQLRGVLSHESAARYWGIPTLQPPALLHVTVPHRCHPAAMAGVRVHQSRNLDPVSTRPWDRSPVTSPLRTVLDCATGLPFCQALAIADSALALKFVSAKELRSAAASTWGPGRPARLRVARLADGRAQNPFESAPRAIMLERGITTFQPQCPVSVGRRELHLDLGDSDRMVAVEAEGFEHHGSRQALARDCERYGELGRRGWIVLRFAWEHVMFRPDWVGDVVVDAGAASPAPGFVTPVCAGRGQYPGPTTRGRPPGRGAAGGCGGRVPRVAGCARGRW